MKKSNEYYNDIANSYRQISEQRKSFLDAIDEYIIDYATNKLNNIKYLDIGAGDGYRSLKIARGIKSKRTVLLDNSDQILAKIESKDNVELVINSILDFDSSIKFDLITCLWNVLGHVGEFEDRKNVFRKLDTLLSDDGVFIFDVNNRYNIAHYGMKNVMNNIITEQNNPEKAGWFTLNQDGHKTQVYVHNPFEIDKYLEDTQLTVEKVEYIDYSTGEKKETFFEGQLLYYIKKK